MIDIRIKLDYSRSFRVALCLG